MDRFKVERAAVKRDRIVQVRCTREWKEAVRAEAARRGITMSDLARIAVGLEPSGYAPRGLAAVAPEPERLSWWRRFWLWLVPV